MRTLNSLVPRRFGAGLPSLFDEFFNDIDRGFSLGASSFVPSLNVSETDSAYKVTAELPGLDEKDFEVTIEDNILRLKGEKKHESEDKEDHYHRYESSYGSFERVLRLPNAIDSDACKAKFKNGVLTLTIPKTEAGLRVKKLKISN